MFDLLQTVFSFFEKNDVRYLVIGGIAAILYGVPRTTLDVDILIDPSTENATKLLKALDEAGFTTAAQIDAQGLLDHEITVFDEDVRIDVQTWTPGITFADAWNHRVIMEHGDQRFYVVSRDDLITSKRAAGRPQDMEDVRALESGGATEDQG